MKLILLTLLAGLFSLTASAQPASKWTAKDRNDFTVECVNAAKAGMSEDSAKYYCSCMLEKLETKYPDPEDAGTITDEDMASPEFQKMIRECLGGYWTNSQRNEFMRDCINSAKPNIGEEKARNYCECMMYKVEMRYHNYHDATTKLTGDLLKSPYWTKLIKNCLQ